MSGFWSHSSLGSVDGVLWRASARASEQETFTSSAGPPGVRMWLRAGPAAPDSRGRCGVLAIAVVDGGAGATCVMPGPDDRLLAAGATTSRGW